MNNPRLTASTMLIVQSDASSAIALHNRIVRDGGRALIASSLPRALLIARNGALDDVLIDFGFDGAAEIVEVLGQRGVPFIYCSADSMQGLSATAGGIPATKFG